WVASSAPAARVLASNAEPALKPNQPAHSRPAPITVIIRLYGTIGSLPKPRRGPSTMAATRPLMPEAMCTTVPPAKSMWPILASQPLGCQIQCATGAYTSTDHSAANATVTPSRMRSAVAPRISAKVMMANDSWNRKNTDSGIVGAATCTPTFLPIRPLANTRDQSPKYALPLEKATEYPHRAHITVISAVAASVCATIDSAFFVRSMPP